jgi:transcriptional regulator with XRE-family HTH domain
MQTKNKHKSKRGKSGMSENILKQIRENEGLTQQQLADYIGKDRSLIAKIECDEASPSVETAKAIGKALGLDWTIFFADKGEAAPQNKS